MIPSIISGKNCSSPVVHDWVEWDNERPVGAGIQLSGSVGAGGVSIAFGFEIIVFWESKESTKAGNPVVAVYAFNGGSLDMSALKDYLDIDKLSELLLQNASLIKDNPQQAITSIVQNSITCSATVSGVLVVGQRGFSSIRDYEGTFSTMTLSNGKYLVGFSQGDTCYSISFGIGKASAGISTSFTYYMYLE